MDKRLKFLERLPPTRYWKFSRC